MPEKVLDMIEDKDDMQNENMTDVPFSKVGADHAKVQRLTTYNLAESLLDNCISVSDRSCKRYWIVDVQ